jgi:hypothetical protein
MRTSQLALAAVLASSTLVGAFAACGAAPAVTVIHGPPAEPVKGDAVRLKRGAQEPYAGVRGGFFVVRTHDDWKRVWEDKGGDAPALPPTLDLQRQMLLLGISDSKEAAELKIERAVETAELVHVWVRETKTGEGCKPRLERAAFDAVVAPRLDKPVRFYVEDARAESCGPPPVAAAQCRIGDEKAWSTKLTAQPGDKIECELTAETRGRFAIVDRVLSLGDLPGGTSSKLLYTRGATRGTFSVDVFGTYTVRAEATDEAGRKGIGTASVEAVPPKTKDVVVQLVWTNFDVSDDPDTFPRTKLRVEDATTAKAKPKECSAVAQDASLCTVKTHSAYTLMTLKAGDKKLPLSVVYRDERIEKGPLACVQLYFEGARTGESCDRKHRDPDEKWDVGTVDLATGKLVDPNAPAAGDAGADAAGDASAEAGPKDAGAPKKK